MFKSTYSPYEEKTRNMKEKKLTMKNYSENIKIKHQNVNILLWSGKH